jgi:hypothetical protein
VTEVFFEFPQFLATDRVHFKRAVPIFHGEERNCLHSIYFFKSLTPFSHYLRKDHVAQGSLLKPITRLYYGSTKTKNLDGVRAHPFEIYKELFHYYNCEFHTRPSINLLSGW